MLRCKPVKDSFKSVVVWFSSGGTKSVLHNDDLDNINCLFRGKKTLILINPHENENIMKNVIDVRVGGYSSVDVDQVDLNKFPDLAGVRYARVDMEAGDCMFIPFLWFHQVNSFGSNLAVNIWWNHYTQRFFDLTDGDCGQFNDTETLAEINLKPLDDSYMDEKKPSSLRKIYRRVYRSKTTMPKEEIREIVVDAQPESLRTWNEKCEKVFDIYWILLDRNIDGKVDFMDAKLFYSSDEKAKKELEQKSDDIEFDLLIAMKVATFDKERELVARLLRRGEIDKKTLAEIYPNDRLLEGQPYDEL